MEKKGTLVSRREKRKEARQLKKKQKNESWIQHMELKKSKKEKQSKGTLGTSTSNYVKESENSFIQIPQVSQCGQKDLNSGGNQSSEETNVQTRLEVVDSTDHNFYTSAKALKQKKGLKRNSKTKFEEYLEMDTKDFDRLAEEDMELERRLAKKLKVKDGKLRGAEDEINMLFEGIASGLDHFDEGTVTDAEVVPLGGVENRTPSKKHGKQKSTDDFIEFENDGTLTNEVPDLVETSGEFMEQDEGAIDTSSSMKRRKRRNSKKKQESDMAYGASELAKINDADEELQQTHINALAVPNSVKYVAPHLRSRARNESEEHTQIRRRVRGLLNRLSESNVESITGEMATIFRSVSRSVGSQIICDEVLAACSGGPRGNEQYAAIFAAFVAGMACSVGMDFSAKLLASLAKIFEAEYLKEDNLSVRNLTLLLSYLCIFGVCSSDLIYDFVIMLGKRLTEIDVSTILTVLQCCGMKIRGDDPNAMKNFIQSVQNRVNELKASTSDGLSKINGKRMEFMLETICDIKNNKKKPKEETAQHTRIKKWLQKLRSEDILIRGLKWSKLLDPDKKGQWWLSGDAVATNNVEEVANTIDKEIVEAQKMLHLAASQRMNTDIRKAIFCIIMSGEDYIDAIEKLLRLDLPGKQDREIMRVLLECCLGEKVFNKYYTILASKLCEHDKNHKKTLQFCLWDHYRELESMQLLRSMHLAKFVAEMIASFSLSLGVLKVAELSDASQLTPKMIIHFRMLFDAIFEYPDKLVWNTFTRLAVNPELEPLRQGIEFFTREYVVKNNNAVANKFKVAKKALNNVEGVLM